MMRMRSKQKETPLWMASQEGTLEVVKVLLEAKAEVDRVNKHEQTPLWVASKGVKLGMVKVDWCENPSGLNEGNHSP